MFKEWWMIKKNVEALEMRCFLPDYQKNWTKKHDESLLFDYPIYSLSFDYPILTNSEERSCNCRNKDNCSVAGSCLKTCIVYRADIITQSETHIYYGASDGEFKYRYNNHTNFVSESRLWKQNWTLKTYLAVKTLWDWVQSKMEYCCVCYTIQVCHKKMWPLSNREVHNSTS